MNKILSLKKFMFEKTLFEKNVCLRAIIKSVKNGIKIMFDKIILSKLKNLCVGILCIR